MRTQRLRPRPQITLLLLLLLLATPAVEAQVAEGNEDRDGVKVPVFSVPIGAVSVENGGEAGVSVDVAVPPGVRGMAPRVTLRYASGAADEGLGSGWTLNLGFPDAIRRSTRFGMPRYTDQDVFTYAGQDLVPSALTAGRYRTRIDSFERIQRSGDTWVVTRKDGTQLEYGGVPQARSSVPGGTYAWHLNRVSDTVGNAIRFDWEGAQTRRRLLRIRYTLDANGSTIGQAQWVLFSWESRPDPRTSAIYGAPITLSTRLSAIRTRSGGVAGRTYDLCYADEGCHGVPAPVKGNSLLASIDESASDGTSLPARRFDYQKRGTGWLGNGGLQTPFPFILHYYDLASHRWRHRDTGLRTADVNGDGKVDLLRNDGQVYLYTEGSNGPNWSLAAGWSVPYQFVFVSPLGNASDTGVRLADVNGDGLVDLLKSLGSTREVRLNNGSGWNPPGQYTIPEPFMFVLVDGYTLASESRGVQLADVNGDGLPDLLRGLKGFDRLVYLNNGVNGWDPAPAGTWALPHDFVDPDPEVRFTSDTGLRVIDVNGDRLDDLVLSAGRPFQITEEVWLNTGSGWTLTGNAFPVRFYDVVTGNGLWWYWDYNVQVVDVDGDGYVDLVKSYATHRTVYLNNQAGGFVEAAGWEVPLSFVAQGMLPDGTYYYVDDGVRLLDVDGDGLADLVRGAQVFNGQNNTFQRSTHLGKPGLADLLARYTNPLGGTAWFAYGQASGLGLPSGQMPFPRTVARRLTQATGLSSAAAAMEYRLEPVEYRFEQGVYDWRSRDFLGFRFVTETRGDDSTRRREFHTDTGRKGAVRKETLSDDEGPYQEKTYDYSGATPDREGVHRTLLSSETVKVFHESDPSQFVTRRATYSYDGYGNQRIKQEYGYGGTRERISLTSYSYDTAAYIVGLPSSIRHYDGRTLALVTAETFERDPRGLVTKDTLLDQRLVGMQLASGSASVVTRYEYDPYGNVSVTWNGRGYRTTIDYSGNGYLFPYRETRENPGGAGDISRLTVYNRALGVLVDQWGPNLERTSYAYDGLGRLRSITFPDDPAGDPGIVVTSYQLGSLPAYRELKVRLSDTRTRTERVYLDGLGRPRATVTGADAAGGQPALWVVSDLTLYDNRGRPRMVYEPFFGQTPSPAPGSRYRLQSYEDDKLSKVSHPDGTSTQTVHLADCTIEVDEKGLKTRRRYNAFGQLVEVTEALDTADAATTSYGYDALGRAHTMVDPRGLVTTSFYDVRGSLRGLSSPDGSQALRNGYQVWNDYDEQGNHTHHWSGSDVWRADFDALDRQTVRYVSADGGGSFYGESVRVYDVHPGAQNGIGRLVRVVNHGWVTTQSVLSYDVRGRLVTETFNFQNLAAPLVNASIHYEYDREGHLARYQDPTGYWSLYSLDVFGQVRGSMFRNSWATSDQSYDAAGRPTQIGFPSTSLTETYEYDLRGRMKTIRWNGISQRSYGYEDNGNLSVELGGRSLQYGYDSRNRLKGLTGTIGVTAVGLQYAYDPSGNLLSVTGDGAADVTYEYVPGTNRLASFWVDGSRSDATHDQHGNLNRVTGSSIRSYVYDVLGRLHTYTGLQGDLLYDGRDRKIARRVNDDRERKIAHKVDDGRDPKIAPTRSGRTEVYFHRFDGKLLAVYDTGTGQWTHYFYVGGRRIAYRAPDNTKLQILHSDRLGSVWAITEHWPACPPKDPECDPHPTYRTVWRGNYLPYGGAIATSASGGDRFRFTGQELEPAAAIYDFGARFYDPQLRRFLQIDSFLGAADAPATLNRYAYALDNPLRFVDPTGHWPGEDLVKAMTNAIQNVGTVVKEYFQGAYTRSLRESGGGHGQIDPQSPPTRAELTTNTVNAAILTFDAMMPTIGFEAEGKLGLGNLSLEVDVSNRGVAATAKAFGTEAMGRVDANGLGGSLTPGAGISLDGKASVSLSAEKVSLGSDGYGVSLQRHGGSISLPGGYEVQVNDSTGTVKLKVAGAYVRYDQAYTKRRVEEARKELEIWQHVFGQW